MGRCCKSELFLFFSWRANFKHLSAYNCNNTTPLQFPHPETTIFNVFSSLFSYVYLFLNMLCRFFFFKNFISHCLWYLLPTLSDENLTLVHSPSPFHPSSSYNSYISFYSGTLFWLCPYFSWVIYYNLVFILIQPFCPYLS